MSPAPSPIVRRRRLGLELRRLREAAGLTGDQVVESVGWASASKLSRMENGRSRPDLSDVLDLLDLYKVVGRARDQLIAITRDAGNTRGWLRSYAVMTQRQRTYAELEAGCVDIREYGPMSVPGLLQTPDYARLRIMSSAPLAEPPVDGRAPDKPDTEVAAREARQWLLTREVDPPRYEAILEETVLRGRGGPPEILRGQAARLHRLAQLPNVTLRILPQGACVGDWYLPHTGFSLYRFADPQDPETVAVEALGTDILVNEPHEVHRYAQVFEWLRTAALSDRDSLAWLGETAGDAAEPLPTPAPTPPAQRRGPGNRVR